MERNGKLFVRIPEVFDCWFESGSMPYGQNHFPFENKEETLSTFPADFIAEGLDQTRGWFYTLNVLSTALYDKPAFKNVIVNGIILAEDGTKMSKRLKNYPEPSEVFDKYGADAVRLYLLHSPVVQAEDLRFSEKGVELVLRQFLIPLWNSYVFLATYAHIYRWTPEESEFLKPKADIDRWILSLLQKLTLDVEKGMDAYVLSQAVEPFVAFIDQLTNWYIRRNRSRFWSDEESEDRDQASETLYLVLLSLTKIAAPFIPFLSEEIYQELRSKKDPESVHLCDFPHYDETHRDETLEEEMAYVQTVVSMGHALRKENKLKVRQPLPLVHLISSDPDVLKLLGQQKHLIMDELNVKEVALESDEAAFVTLKVKPNFRTLGKRVGPLMKQVKKAVDELDKNSIDNLINGKEIHLNIDDQMVTLTAADVTIEREVKEGLIASSEGNVTIALETTLNEALLLEGLARELVNKINSQRRNEKFEVTDRVSITLDTTPKVKECFNAHKEYITHEVLARHVHFAPTRGTEWDLNGEKAIITLEKA